MYYRRLLALLLFLLLCFSASADYLITDSEMAELERILLESQAQLQASKEELRLLANELQTLQEQSQALQAELTRLSAYWTQYASAQKQIKTVMGLALAATSSVLVIAVLR